MERQLDNFQTFFDLGLDNDKKLNFATISSLISGKTKKRVFYNSLVVKMFRGEDLNLDDLTTAVNVADGSIYKNKNKLCHCKLCSDNFDRIVLSKFSRRYNKWEVCFPTHPYYPAGMMIYLRERATKKTENFQDLENCDIEELLVIISDMMTYLQNMVDFEVVGINVLFQQISKSQSCIHGHVEIMVKNPHLLNIGYKINNEMPHDKLAAIINNSIDEHFLDCLDIVKSHQGMRVFVNNNFSRIKSLVSEYEKKINELIVIGRKLQKNIIDQDVESTLKKMLIEQLSPAPVFYVYLSLYRDKTMLSLVPEIILDPVLLSQIGDNERDLYAIKVNQYAISDKNRFFYQYSPLVRPSIKVTSDIGTSANVKKMTRIVFKSLEKKGGT